MKKLSLDVRLSKANEKVTFEDELVKILNCDHGLEEIRFVRHGWLKPWSSFDEKWIDRTIFRNEFPELVSYLRTREENFP